MPSLKLLSYAEPIAFWMTIAVIAAVPLVVLWRVINAAVQSHNDAVQMETDKLWEETWERIRKARG